MDTSGPLTPVLFSSYSLANPTNTTVETSEALVVSQDGTTTVLDSPDGSIASNETNVSYAQQLLEECLQPLPVTGFPPSSTSSVSCVMDPCQAFSWCYDSKLDEGQGSVQCAACYVSSCPCCAIFYSEGDVIECDNADHGDDLDSIPMPESEEFAVPVEITYPTPFTADGDLDETPAWCSLPEVQGCDYSQYVICPDDTVQYPDYNNECKVRFHCSC